MARSSAPTRLQRPSSGAGARPVGPRIPGLHGVAALAGLLALPALPGAADSVAQTAEATPAAGAYRLLPDSRFEVRTEPDGVLSGMVHTHVVRAGAFAGTVGFDPADPSRSSVEITVPVDSLVVDTDADPDDRASIRQTMMTEVLRASEHPTITFRSTGVEAAPEDSLRITGELSLAGTTRSVTVTLAHSSEVGRLWVWGSFTVRQTDFGIEPYSAGLGTLKVADPVTFYVDAVARAVLNDRSR